MILNSSSLNDFTSVSFTCLPLQEQLINLQDQRERLAQFLNSSMRSLKKDEYEKIRDELSHIKHQEERIIKKLAE